MSHTTDELYAVYTVTVRRSRHDRACFACGLQINAGDRYADVRIIFDGKAETIRRCGRCQAIHEHLQGCADGETWPDERLSCGMDYVEEWGEEPPEHIQAAVFATASEASALLVPGARHHMIDHPRWCAQVAGS